MFVSGSDARWVNNLADRSKWLDGDRVQVLDDSNLAGVLASARLDELARTETLRRSLRPCDEALLQVVSRWKLLLKADYPSVDNRNLSALFNALIFIRGCEDRNSDDAHGSSRVLLRALEEHQANENVDVLATLRTALQQTGIDNPLADYVQEQALAPFGSVDFATAFNLFREMYAPKDAPYDFNFALMSKHALSRIYEKYVSILQPDEPSSQTSIDFAQPLPKEAAPSKTGAVYTPQFVASFFSRFLRENLTPRSFRELRAIDPACGSGLFLRSLLELQCDPFAPGTTTETIRHAFANSHGIDKDINACEAARLSLALLHLIATGNLPGANDLHIVHADAIAERLSGRIESGAYGAIMSNPPYIKLDHLSSAEREIYRDFLGDDYAGRLDAYIPFVRLCLDLAQPGGIICMVLPQTFLTASNASTLREDIAAGFDVRCLVDLSAIPVFEGVGTYTILLILQRRVKGEDGLPAQVAQVTEAAGAALQACLDGRTVRNRYFNVFPVTQSFFRSKQWVIVNPEQIRINERLAEHPTLSRFMNVAQGVVTGADNVFIRDRADIPRGEERIYLDFLADRQIGRYVLPKRTDKMVFFPFIKGEIISEETLSSQFPETWKYLNGEKEFLSSRRSVAETGATWWRPVRARESTILRPKIVCPHLMLTPRFAVNASGKFAVSRSPFIIAPDEGEEQTLVKFFCAVLNSTVCNWYIRTFAPKYGGGYNRLEVGLLKSIPVPDLSEIDSSTLTSIVGMVDRLFATENSHRNEVAEIDKELDDIVCGLYGFSPTERRELFGLS